MSSDNSSSDEESEKPTDKGLNLAGFLFGNIDQDGKLEDSFLDETSKKKLGGLSSVLGLKSIIEEETKDVKADEDYEAGSKVRKMTRNVTKLVDFTIIFFTESRRRGFFSYQRRLNG